MVRRTDANSCKGHSRYTSHLLTRQCLSVCLLPFLKLLSVGADLSSWLILDQRSGPKCLRECSPYFVVLRQLGKNKL